MNSIYNEEQGIESIILRQAVFSLSQFCFLHFPQCGAISHFFYNNKYIIRLSLTNGVTDMGICFFKK